jgi:precorrin-6A synthase
MRRILIIGIGAGNPDYLTVQAVKALNQVDVFFVPDKGAEKAALQRYRIEICERFIEHPNYRIVTFNTPRRAEAGGSYTARVDVWHAELAAEVRRLVFGELSEDQCGAFLVWGDPSLYDSTLRLIERLLDEGARVEFDVIPGISAIQALAARHRISLNRIGLPVLITTGRRLTEGMASQPDDVVVMLDGEQAFSRVDSHDHDIYWGAYLGTEDEILIAGKLSDVAGKIVAERAKAREKHGWIMDT